MGDVRAWDERFRRGEHDALAPTDFLVRVAGGLAPGRALDLASGTGRHALHLASLGWEVVAVDGSTVALDRLRDRTEAAGVSGRVTAVQRDLEVGPRFVPEPASFDLVCVFHYLNRPLIPALLEAVRPGGHAAFAIHVGEAAGEKVLAPGELARWFDAEWELLVDEEEAGTTVAASPAGDPELAGAVAAGAARPRGARRTARVLGRRGRAMLGAP